MEASRLLLDLLHDHIQLQLIDGRLRVAFPPGSRTPDRVAAIRAERDRLIDLASRSPVEILASLRQVGIIVSLDDDQLRVAGDQSVLTAEFRALLRFHKAALVNQLRWECSKGAKVLERIRLMADQLMEFSQEELDAYRLELVNSPEDDPATPEEWGALIRTERIRAGGPDRYVRCPCGTSRDRLFMPVCPTCHPFL